MKNLDRCANQIIFCSFAFYFCIRKQTFNTPQESTSRLTRQSHTLGSPSTVFVADYHQSLCHPRPKPEARMASQGWRCLHHYSHQYLGLHNLDSGASTNLAKLHSHQ